MNAEFRTAVIRDVMVYKRSFSYCAQRYQIDAGKVEAIIRAHQEGALQNAWEAYRDACVANQWKPVPFAQWRYHSGILPHGRKPAPYLGPLPVTLQFETREEVDSLRVMLLRAPEPVARLMEAAIDSRGLDTLTL